MITLPISRIYLPTTQHLGKITNRKDKNMPRDYKDEYAKFQNSESQKNDRVKRNKNRRNATKNGRVSRGDGKDIDHIDGNPMNNSPNNLRVVPKSINRAKR